MSASIEKYLALIASEHQSQPDYTAFISIFLQGQADAAAVAASLPLAFDLDTAVGVQLDRVGQWIGQDRLVREPITDTYFSWDTDNLGWDEGIWYVTGDPDSDTVSLPDDIYRQLLRAVAQANRWNGTVPQANSIWATLFEGTPYGVMVIDNMDMTMTLAMYGGVPDPITYALFTGGYLKLKPVGVRINEYIIPTDTGPLFGFGIESSTIAGFGTGVWAEFIPA